jgi:hypothetical protein
LKGPPLWRPFFRAHIAGRITICHSERTVRCPLGRTQRSEESPLHYPDPSAAPQDDNLSCRRISIVPAVTNIPPVRAHSVYGLDLLFSQPAFDCLFTCDDGIDVTERLNVNQSVELVLVLMDSLFYIVRHADVECSRPVGHNVIHSVACLRAYRHKYAHRQRKNQILRRAQADKRHLVRGSQLFKVS